MRQKQKRYVVLLAGGVLLLAAFLSYSALFGDRPVSVRMVSGTEYISGETGQVIVRVSDYRGNPVTGATCNATILYPDKSYFLLDYSLQQSTVSGNYYAQFTTPTVNGIYEETIICSTAGSNPQTSTISSSFHVSVALNFIVELSQQQAIRYNDLVRRLNETQTQLNQTRDTLLQEINETFTYDIAAIIEQSRLNVTGEIRQSQNVLNDSVSGRFDGLYVDMVAFGNSVVSIFGS
jgi:hypothetical protein